MKPATDWSSRDSVPPRHATTYVEHRDRNGGKQTPAGRNRDRLLAGVRSFVALQMQPKGPAGYETYDVSFREQDGEAVVVRGDGAKEMRCTVRK